jgi:hypothetical protein
VLLLVACVPAARPGGTEPVVTERLYFGRNIGDTLGVTDSLWAIFVRDVIAARFPAGFTYWIAAGGWRDSTGRTTREPSFVLEVIHPGRAAGVDSAVAAVIAEYKRRFHQQSVLRVLTAGRASF